MDCFLAPTLFRASASACPLIFLRSAVVKSDVVENRALVDEFFSKIAGEDVTKITDVELFDKIANLDGVEAAAFEDITELCLGRE